MITTPVNFALGVRLPALQTTFEGFENIFHKCEIRCFLRRKDSFVWVRLKNEQHANPAFLPLGEIRPHVNVFQQLDQVKSSDGHFDLKLSEKDWITGGKRVWGRAEKRKIENDHTLLSGQLASV